jgi:hypothetical protein
VISERDGLPGFADSGVQSPEVFGSAKVKFIMNPDSNNNMPLVPLSICCHPEAINAK